MDITPNLINELENMSSFSLDVNEKEQMSQEIAQMLSFMDNIKDVSVVEYDDSDLTGLDDFARDDVKENSADVFDAIANAKMTVDNYFTVPKVVD